MKKRLLIIIVVSVSACVSRKDNSLKNSIYKFGYKTESTSTGPLSNSAFTMKINDTVPALFLTAHHCVAGIGNGQYLKWNEVDRNMKDAWAWSMQDKNYKFKIGPNLPIKKAETLKLDLAAFYLQSDTIPYLKPAQKVAEVRDTVYLYSLITHNDKSTFRNRGVVIYATDSILVYELTDFNMARIMSGTSGSSVVNKDYEVVSNSYAGFTIPSEEERRKMAIEFPLISKLNTKVGKTYGVGLPIQIIKKSLIQAFKVQNQARNNYEWVIE